MATATRPFIGWLAHDENNKVCVLYNPEHDSTQQEIKELAKLVRRGLIVREIIDEVEARGVWGRVLSERKMGHVASPPTYDDDQGSATAIATALVEGRQR